MVRVDFDDNGPCGYGCVIRADLDVVDTPVGLLDDTKQKWSTGDWYVADNKMYPGVQHPATISFRVTTDAGAGAGTNYTTATVPGTITWPVHARWLAANATTTSWAPTYGDTGYTLSLSGTVTVLTGTEYSYFNVRDWVWHDTEAVRFSDDSAATSGALTAGSGGFGMLGVWTLGFMNRDYQIMGFASGIEVRTAGDGVLELYDTTNDLRLCWLTYDFDSTEVPVIIGFWVDPASGAVYLSAAFDPKEEIKTVSAKLPASVGVSPNGIQMMTSDDEASVELIDLSVWGNSPTSDYLTGFYNARRMYGV